MADISKKNAEELVKVMMPVREMAMHPKPKGVVSKQDLAKGSERPGKKAKAVLFIPEDASVSDNLRIEVVGIKKDMFMAMVARRC
ncbi:MAG: hypothetical protein ACM3JB_21120 [Acidobacteriaceae bacterium]